MEVIGKIAVIAVAAALCAMAIKKQTPEIGLALTLCAGAIVLTLTADGFRQVYALMETMANTAGISPAIFGPVIKTVGIALLTRIAASLCNDAKESGLASCVEIGGSVCALWVCLPLMQAVLNMILELL